MENGVFHKKDICRRRVAETAAVPMKCFVGRAVVSESSVYMIANRQEYEERSNYSAGLRSCRADRKKTLLQQAKIPSLQAVFVDFCMKL